MSDLPTGKTLLLDEAALSSDSALPAFLSRPEDAPVYHGFPVIEETCTEGWCYGAITEFLDPDGCESGDGFVVAPDGSRAGLVWEVGEHNPVIEEVLPPEAGRWGVWGIWFLRPIRTMDDLVFNFRDVLPTLQEKHRASIGLTLPEPPLLLLESNNSEL